MRGRGEECLHSEMTAAFVREDHTNIQLARFTHPIYAPTHLEGTNRMEGAMEVQRKRIQDQVRQLLTLPCTEANID